MDTSRSTLGTFYASWETYQNRLITAIAPLTDEQLALKAAPHLRSIGDITVHMIGARALWMHRIMDEREPELAVLAGLAPSERAGRTADELVQGLRTTWRVMQECLARWTTEDMAQTFEGVWDGRKWAIWHLIEHDLHHGGELALTLGMHGLAAPDL
jgi:uncharacterized damage-inducible protein DinB